MLTPGSSRTGRMFANVSKSLRSVTLADFSPKPTGVPSGPLSTTRVLLIESIVSCGTPEAMPCLNTRSPACRSIQSMPTPVALTISTAAATHSGPIPSPGITVTAWRDMKTPREGGAGGGQWRQNSEPQAARASLAAFFRGWIAGVAPFFGGSCIACPVACTLGHRGSIPPE